MLKAASTAVASINDNVLSEEDDFVLFEVETTTASLQLVIVTVLVVPPEL
jgi:hypothetical protein